MLSEKTYWFVLIIAFSGFSLTIWFWLMPYQIVEYNLGVNLLTSSIFMVFTIVFLSWLSRLRERLQWKSARDQLYHEISARLFSIFRQVFLFVDPTAIGDMPKTVFARRLEKLSNESDEDFQYMLESTYLQSEKEISAIIKGWARRDRDFISMEMHNFQSFFDPELRVHMVNILSALGDLEYLLDLKEKHSIANPWGQGQFIIDLYLGRISYSIHTIVKEIHEVSKMGIEIYRQQWLCPTCDRPAQG